MTYVYAEKIFYISLYVHAQCSIILWREALLKDILIYTSVFLSFHAHTHSHTTTDSHTLRHWPEQRNLLLLICAMRLLARRRGLAQRAPLVSMGFERRKSASHFTLQSHTKGFWARWLMRNQREEEQNISRIRLNAAELNKNLKQYAWMCFLTASGCCAASWRCLWPDSGSCCRTVTAEPSSPDLWTLRLWYSGSYLHWATWRTIADKIQKQLLKTILWRELRWWQDYRTCCG